MHEKCTDNEIGQDNSITNFQIISHLHFYIGQLSQTKHLLYSLYRYDYF